LKLFLKTINEFHYDHSEKLGDAFEYLLSVLGSQGDAGQFRTPRHIIDFIVEVLQPKKTETICDPACGTAGFLISSYKHILKTHSPLLGRGVRGEANKALTPEERKKLMKNFVGYDISPDMVRLSLVNMYLHGFITPNIYEYDTLTSEDRWSEYYDVILANPPFMSPKGGIKPHKKFTIQANRSEVLFVDYIAEHIHPSTGRAGIIVPEGIIFQSATAYKALRKMLVDKNLLYAVVSLPAGIFQPYSGVKTSILLMDKTLAKKTDNILFVKIDNDGFDLGAQRKAIAQNDLTGCLELLQQYKTTLQDNTTFESDNKNVFLVGKNKIADKDDYNLSIDRYRANENVQQSNFEMVRLADVCEIKKGASITKKDTVEGNIPVIAGGQQPAYFHNEANRNGEVITVSSSGAYAGFINYFNEPIFASDCTTIQTTDNPNLNCRFLYQMLKAQQEYFYSLQKGGAQPHVYGKDFGELEIPLPPLEIQQQIVSKIESFQKIIDGAKQVTENYKPQIDIDASWEMVELESVLKLSSGKGLTQQNMIEGNYPVYGGNGINGYHNKYFIEEPIITIGRVGAYCGAVHITKPKSWITDNALYVTEYLKEVNQKYLAQILTQLELNRFAKVGGQPSISQSTVYERAIPLPPLATQQEIVNRIGQEQGLVNANKELIKIYEQKIKDEIGKVWKK